jgi:hypothetical protein
MRLISLRVLDRFQLKLFSAMASVDHGKRKTSVLSVMAEQASTDLERYEERLPHSMETFPFGTIRRDRNK